MVGSARSDPARALRNCPADGRKLLQPPRPSRRWKHPGSDPVSRDHLLRAILGSLPQSRPDDYHRCSVPSKPARKAKSPAADTSATLQQPARSHRLRIVFESRRSYVFYHVLVTWLTDDWISKHSTASQFVAAPLSFSGHVSQLSFDRSNC